MANLHWKSGLAGNYDSAASWMEGVAPAPGDTTNIGLGTARIVGENGDSIPNNVTLTDGVLVSDTSISPSSIISFTDTSVTPTFTLNETVPGGSYQGGTTGPVERSGIGIHGAVNFGGTINVGPGDTGNIGIDASRYSPNSGFFNNAGTINVTGSGPNRALETVSVGTDEHNSTAGVFARYGTVNINDANFVARVTDTGSNGAADYQSAFNLKNGAYLRFENDMHANTTVNMLDGSNERLILAPDANNQILFQGTIQGFQAGDKIGLLDTAPVGSINYDQDSHLLRVNDASGKLITSLYIAGDHNSSDSSVSQNSEPPSPYTSEYDIITVDHAATPLTSSYGQVLHDATSPSGEVYALYEGLLGRAPDTAGGQGWTAALTSGTSLHDVTTAILASPEAKIHLNATDNAGFVEQLYETVLHRQGDAAGLQTWTSTLDGGTSRADVADSFVFSPEHIASLQPALDAGIFVPDQNAINIAQLYHAELGRAPDASGLQSYTSAIESGSTSLHDIAQAALNSPEYASSHGGVSDSAYVQDIYQQVLGRAADASGLQTWTDALSHGSDRASVVIAMVDSPEFQGQYANQSNTAYVEALYEHVLGRQGDASGLQTWTNALDSHAESRVDLANAFVNSPEFQAHLSQLSGGQSDAAFVQSLYQNALGRAADAGGLQTWTDALAHGTSRADVAVSIAESPEAQQHLGAQIQQGWHVA